MKARHLLLLWLLLAVPVLSQERIWSQGRSRGQIEATLRSARVLSLRPLAAVLPHWDGSNDYFLAQLEGGSQAVFRSEDEPWGSLAEVAGYRFDTWLGTQLVPPTVERLLSRQDLAEGVPWPWESAQRRGSLQFWVETGSRALSEEDLGDVEVLSFVMGRYDNHSGNLLTGRDGRAVVIDFESCLDMQRVRYGETPFVRRGGRVKGRGVPRQAEFPFDHPQMLVDPSLEQIRSTFGPWWNQSWPEGMAGLFVMLRNIPRRTIPYAIWDGRLWVQVNVKSRHPAWTRHHNPATLARLKELNEATVAGLLGEPFRAEHAQGALERTRQLLAATHK